MEKKLSDEHEFASSPNSVLCLFQTAHRLVTRYGAVICEDLSPTFMLANHRLAQAASDVAISQFFDILAFEGHRYHVPVVFVDPKNTSQICSRCGQIVSKELGERVHSCPHCGYVASRDVNAAVNIGIRGMEMLGRRYRLAFEGTGGTPGTSCGIELLQNAGGDTAPTVELAGSMASRIAETGMHTQAVPPCASGLLTLEARGQRNNFKLLR